MPRGKEGLHRAVCYCRVSTQEQSLQGVSLEAQEERLLAYCLAGGLKAVEIIREEGVSAGKPLATRPGGQALLHLVAKKKVRHRIPVKRERLFRDTIACLTMARNWDKAGIALHLIEMGGQSMNTASAMGKVFLTMTAAFAELERNLISERTAAALAHKKAHLAPYASTPFGFDRQGDRLLENALEQEALLLIQAWREAGWSLRRIAQELTRRGIPTKKGGLWYAGTIRYLLGNDLYPMVQ